MYILFPLREGVTTSQHPILRESNLSTRFRLKRGYPPYWKQISIRSQSHPSNKSHAIKASRGNRHVKHATKVFAQEGSTENETFCAPDLHPAPAKNAANNAA